MSSPPVIYIELIRWISVYKGLSVTERRDYKDFFNSLKVLHLNKEISIRAMENAVKADSVDACRYSYSYYGNVL
ncbi:hypothetical protein QIU18_13170 [Capnocytophaga canimorsus]|nr:hypothetical protein [Capnocytophaga canimorsus]WGU70369.1 hypothetical protein QIU18_13170 [Capnocytophaga canimorsus]